MLIKKREKQYTNKSIYNELTEIKRLLTLIHSHNTLSNMKQDMKIDINYRKISEHVHNMINEYRKI